jgi:hypothetical protein
LDANSLLDIIKKAKKDSQINAINAEFSIEEDEPRFVAKESREGK